MDPQDPLGPGSNILSGRLPERPKKELLLICSNVKTRPRLSPQGNREGWRHPGESLEQGVYSDSSTGFNSASFTLSVVTSDKV